MKKLVMLSVLSMLFSLNACAPKVYERTYYEYRPPVHRVVVHKTKHHYRPIEIVLFADSKYRGRYPSPVQLVIYDGQYIEIPLYHKHGKPKRIYAHYAHGVLHFVKNRHGKGIPESSRYSYDSRWDKGRVYGQIKVGKDFELTGLKLKVRTVSNQSRANLRSDQKSKNHSNPVQYIQKNTKKKPTVVHKRVVTHKPSQSKKPTLKKPKTQIKQVKIEKNNHINKVKKSKVIRKSVQKRIVASQDQPKKKTRRESVNRPHQKIKEKEVGQLASNDLKNVSKPKIRTNKKQVKSQKENQQKQNKNNIINKVVKVKSDKKKASNKKEQEEREPSAKSQDKPKVRMSKKRL